MTEDGKETCMKELDFQIMDQDEKVTAVQLSNTWSISLVEATNRLEAFVKKNEEQDLQREFLVRGISKNSTAVITVVPETKIESIEKKLETFSKSLFSVSKKRPSFSNLNYKLETPQVINLPLDCGSRPVVVHVIPDARPAMEKEKKKNIFAVPASSKKPEESKKPATESKPQPIEKTPQKAGTSPEKGKSSSATKKSAEKSTKGKPVVQLGKGSIASFFGQKSGTSPPSSTEKKSEVEKETPVKKEEAEKMDVEEEEEEEVKPKKKPAASTKETKKVPKVEPESPKPAAAPAKSTKSGTEKSSTADDSSRKRNLSSDRGSDADKKKGKSSPEEPSSKKAKKEVKTKKVEKRSRIMAICDSDSSGDEASSKPPTQVDSDEEEEAPKAPAKLKKEVKEVEKKKASPDENRNPANKKRKAIRKVTKSYQDEDGFIRTVRETEEYSCSEEEEPVAEKASSKVSPAKTESKPTSAAPKAKPATKQGSIMSFFGKK